MKILQISTFFHPVTGGVESHVLNLARELEKNGHEVEVLCSDSSKLKGRISQKETDYFGIKVHRFRSRLDLSFYHKFFPGIFRFLLNENYDLIHVHGLRKTESYIALLAGKLKHKPVVLTTHNPFATSSREGAADLLIKLHDLTAGKILLKKFSAIITIVPSEKQILMEKFSVPASLIHEIPNGIEQVFFQTGDERKFYEEWNIKPDKWDGIVVGVARISYAKGFQNLKQAVKKLKNTLFFFAGGDDGYLQKLKQLYRDNDNVIFSEKFIAPEKQIDMYAAASTLVVPSLHEAFGIVIMEALAQKVPVIATNKGGPPEIYKTEAVKLVDPEDQEAWKLGIEALIRNKTRQESLGEVGSQFALQFGWNKITKRIEDIYAAAMLI